MNRISCALAALLLSVASVAWASPSGVVISQVYGGGGNSGATLRQDFVELFNAGTAPVSLAGWSVQYASATGSSWQITPLTAVSLQPGQYYLVQQAQGTGGSVNLPAPDAAGNILMSSSQGKIALVRSTSALSGSAPISSNIEDFVGFGSANHAEASPAPTLSNTTAALRAANGCTDTDNNSADFTTGAPAPRNSTSPLNVCGGVINAPIVPVCTATTLSQGAGGQVAFSASDADSRVGTVSIVSGSVAGITLGSFTPAVADGASLTGSIDVAAAVPAGSYSLGLLFGNDEAQSASCTLSITVESGAASYTPIYQIQGPGNSSPLNGQTLTTQGVVTAVFSGISGYYLQDETGDGNVETSDGIFVYSPGGISVSVGQRVRLNGTVTEFNTVTELINPNSIAVLASGINIAPTPIALPETFNGELERYEGMLVRIDVPMTVAQNFFQGRFGQLTLSAGGRLIKPTNVFPAGSPEALALAAENARRVLILDDGRSSQNPNPIPYIGQDNTLRAGDSVSNLVGIIDHGLINSDTSATAPRDYRLHPVEPPVFTRDNPRTAAPSAVGGNVKIASFNVLNYFTTLDVAGSGCFPSGTRNDCRGADSATEFARQQAKIVAAMLAINADVFGLMEIENNGNVAAQNLANALNAQAGAGTWAVVPMPASGTGGDAIRQAILYKPSRLSLLGSSLSDTDPIHDRPPIAQTFAAANGEKFSVIVNHFKSKNCGSVSGVDADQGDGQGCFNNRRTLQAQRLAQHFVPLIQTASGDADVLVIGDLNAYGKEDPVLALIGAGFEDQLARFVAQPYTYIFDGESGHLDHALANASMAAQITAVTGWHINTDEPSVIDYNTEFKPQDLYTPSAYRSSDHDPVIVGLQLVRTLTGTALRDTLTGTVGDDRIVGGPGADMLTGGAGRDDFVYESLRDAGDTILDFVPGTDRIELAALLASIGYNGGSQAASDGVLRLVQTAAGTSVQIDTDGHGPAAARPLVLLKNVALASLDVMRDFIY